MGRQRSKADAKKQQRRSRPPVTPYHEENVRADALNQLGQGVARLNDGLCVFVDGLLPGESARVRIKERKKTYARATIVELLETSAERQEARCPVFPRCGGCTLQHCRYEAQLRYKAERVRDTLLRIGTFAPELIDELLPPGSLALASPEPWHYRCKSAMPLGGTSAKPEIGFYAASSHTIVDADTCPIQHPAADLVRRALRRALVEQPLSLYDEASGRGLLRHLVVRSSHAYPDVNVSLVLNLSLAAWKDLPEESIERLFFQLFLRYCSDDVTSGGYSLSGLQLNHHCQKNNRIDGPDYTVLYASGPLRERIGEIEYHISPAAFFQINPGQTEALYKAAVKAAGLSGQENVFDLYCGSGSISLQLASSAQRVIGCELVEAAIADAKNNAELNKIENCEFFAGAAEVLLPELLSSYNADVVVVDPPRKGLDASLISCLRSTAAERIVYVSCDPATLARDCKLLCEGGLYELSSVECFDMFPHSLHVECVVGMSREGGKMSV